MISQDIGMKEDPLLPVPARRKPTVSMANRISSPLRVSELPERLSSLTGLHKALNEFPLPPMAAPLSAVSRYTISNVSQTGLSRDGGDGKNGKDRGNGKSGWF